MRLLLLLFPLFFAFPALAAPQIIVTIPPVYALISGVTEGITEPTLLISNHASPYTYSLPPVDAKKLREADVVFLVSRRFERFLERPLKANHKARATVIELAKAEGMALLPLRGKSDSSLDPYLWLNPQNAMVIIRTAQETLSRIDPANAARYTANAEQLLDSLKQLDNELTNRLAPYSDVSYLVTSDYYQYFEKHYHLNGLGEAPINIQQEPDSTALTMLQHSLTRNNVVCLFAAPGDTSEILARISELTHVGTGTLDAFGENAPDASAYFTLMQRLSQSITTCFDQKRSLMS